MIFVLSTIFTPALLFNYFPHVFIILLICLVFTLLLLPYSCFYCHYFHFYFFTHNYRLIFASSVSSFFLSFPSRPSPQARWGGDLDSRLPFPPSHGLGLSVLGGHGWAGRPRKAWGVREARGQGGARVTWALIPGGVCHLEALTRIHGLMVTSLLSHDLFVCLYFDLFVYVLVYLFT